MSNEIVKSGDGWTLRVSPVIKSRIPFRQATFHLQSGKGIDLVEGTYSFRLLDAEWSAKALQVENFGLLEVRQLHSDYQRVWNSLAMKLKVPMLDSQGFSGFVKAQGIYVELRLPMNEELQVYWPTPPTYQPSCVQFGGCDTLFALIQTERIKAHALVNLHHLRHLIDFRFEKIRKASNPKECKDFVLAYKEAGKWVQGESSFSQEIDVTRLPL